MAQTSNIGLYKLGANSKLKDFPTLFNDDLEIIDSAVGGLNSKIMKTTHLGNVETYTAAGGLILTAIGGMTDYETRNMTFGAIATQTYWTTGTLFSGFVTRYNSGIFAGLFTNQIGETISISTHDGGTNYFYSTNAVRGVDLTSYFSSYSYMQYPSCWIVKNGRVVTFNFSAYFNSSHSTASGVEITNLIPEGYRPTIASAFGSLNTRLAYETVPVYIEQGTGTLQIDSNTLAGTWVGVTITYIVV